MLLQSNLRSEATNLVNKTRDLTDSKYMHVQLTARRIFDILMAEPWQDFLYADYQANPDQLLKDMLRPAYLFTLIISFFIVVIGFDEMKTTQRRHFHIVQYCIGYEHFSVE